MRRNVRDVELAGPFIQKLTEMTKRRENLLIGIVDQMAFVETTLQRLAEKVRSYEGGWAQRRSQNGWSLMWMWRASEKVGRVSCVEVYLSKGTKKGGDFQRVSLRTVEARLDHMTPLLGRKRCKSFSRDLELLLDAARRAVRWVNAFPANDLGILVPKSKATGLDEWISALARACETRSVKAAGLIEKYLELDNELNQLAFEFNEARQPVRFRSIICRRECPSLDPLSPGEPRYRVVEYFDRRTGKRSSRDVSSYKQRLNQQKVRDRLALALGRPPTEADLSAVISARPNRKPSPWLTEELISHCHLGKHSGSINKHQKNMVAILEEWASMRALIRALL
ncbi:hypothetical protein LCG56_29005 (plasmid) [Pseudomonas cannabina pv. alisalensis]|uniref:Uncharacterized protein n=1 Tax=Pseudomonas syringae pv. maculicola str. ES4326 TaxID=629265 RepID=A0A8T8C9Q6_PSEYM|nr:MULTISPECIES: hypothetical protein [Pseudomonas syringae group]QHF00433.1 hypothetical protein PMA4326_028350 [Pseudomonas syringae pv. maculicola str. ES4326]UBZ00409.1 hypothetical protein LCG56_29005 [Pseudomonas cannabina pv. alisalensis]